MPWVELTFPFGGTLTSSDMNALHENYAATFAGNSGSPVSKFDALNFTQNDLTQGINSGSAVVLSQGMYQFLTGSGPYASNFNYTKLQHYDGSSWYDLTDEYLGQYGSGLFMTFSNNYRIYMQGAFGVSVDSPVIYRYD